jgi:hypothetical protein
MLVGIKVYMDDLAIGWRTKSFTSFLKHLIITTYRLPGYIKNGKYIMDITKQLSEDPSLIVSARMVFFCWNKFLSVHFKKLSPDSNVLKFLSINSNGDPNAYTDEFMVEYQYIMNGVDIERTPFESIIKILHYADGVSGAQYAFLMSWAKHEDELYLSTGSQYVASDGLTYTCKGPVAVVGDDVATVHFFRNYQPTE